MSNVYYSKQATIQKLANLLDILQMTGRTAIPYTF